MNIKIDLPKAVSYIIDRLERHGHEVYVVGGCVRDSILGRRMNDWDICTSARSVEIEEAFAGESIIPTGIKHGTVTILLKGAPYEITTYRIDGDYSDHRRPDSVTFTTNLEEDLKRRDFTINAMAYNPSSGLADPFGGRQDLQNEIIRCVGNPDDRFNEDALRIMRAVRFSCQLGFNIEPETQSAIHRNCGLLDSVSNERITSELNKILISGNMLNFFSNYFDILIRIVPEFAYIFDSKQKDCTAWVRTLASIDRAEGDLIVKLAVLFHDIAKPSCCLESKARGQLYERTKLSADMVNEILRRMKYDNRTRERATQLIEYYNEEIEPSCKSVKKWLNILGEQQFRRLIEVKRAIYIEDAMLKLNEVENIVNEVLNEQQCFSLKDLAVNGKDLLEIGYTPGEALGAALSDLLESVISDEVENNKQNLIELAKTRLNLSIRERQWDTKN